MSDFRTTSLLQRQIIDRASPVKSAMTRWIQPKLALTKNVPLLQEKKKCCWAKATDSSGRSQRSWRLVRATYGAECMEHSRTVQSSWNHSSVGSRVTAGVPFLLTVASVMEFLRVFVSWMSCWASLHEAALPRFDNANWDVTLLF